MKEGSRRHRARTKRVEHGTNTNSASAPPESFVEPSGVIDDITASPELGIDAERPTDFEAEKDHVGDQALLTETTEELHALHEHEHEHEPVVSSLKHAAVNSTDIPAVTMTQGSSSVPLLSFVESPMAATATHAAATPPMSSYGYVSLEDLLACPRVMPVLAPAPDTSSLVAELEAKVAAMQVRVETQDAALSIFEEEKMQWDQALTHAENKAAIAEQANSTLSEQILDSNHTLAVFTVAEQNTCNMLHQAVGTLEERCEQIESAHSQVQLELQREEIRHKIAVHKLTLANSQRSTLEEEYAIQKIETEQEAEMAATCQQSYFEVKSLLAVIGDVNSSGNTQHFDQTES